MEVYSSFKLLVISICFCHNFLQIPSLSVCFYLPLSPSPSLTSIIWQLRSEFPQVKWLTTASSSSQLTASLWVFMARPLKPSTSPFPSFSSLLCQSFTHSNTCKKTEHSIRRGAPILIDLLLLTFSFGHFKPSLRREEWSGRGVHQSLGAGLGLTPHPHFKDGSHSLIVLWINIWGSQCWCQRIKQT